jgi:micrococcal nuclease
MHRNFLLAFLTTLFSLLTLSSSHSANGALDVELTQDHDVIVQTLLINHGFAPLPYVFIVQVEDESGIVVFLDYESGTVPRYINQDASITWRPGNDETYTIKTLVWSSLDGPESMDFLVGQLRIDTNGETKVLCTGSASCFTGTVTDIIDGDTLDIGDVRIRLSLVDSPERDEAGYSEASDFTAEMCPVGSRVVVDQDDGQLIDDFGRLLAKITCEGNNVLNAELLESGHGEVLSEYCGESEYSTESWISERCMVVGIPPGESPVPVQENPSEEEENCHPSYPDVCIPSPPPDLDCGDISYRNFRVVGSDPHRFDVNNDGVGCED